MNKKIDILIPDTSVIVEGLVSRRINEDQLKPETIIIHEAVIAELEHQANMNKAIGMLGLDELLRIRDLCQKSSEPIQF